MKWEFQTENAVKSSPSVFNDTLFFGSDDGKIYAVDINDGSQTWAYDTGSAVETSPAINNDNIIYGN